MFSLPSQVRKQRAMEAELDQNLAETCDNVESPQSSPTETRKHVSHNGDGLKYIYNGDNGIYQLAEQEHRRSIMRGYHGTRNASLDSSPLLDLDNKLRSPGSRSVSRSASQDSVGSVHSDISHDRTRTHNVLAKSSKLLQDRQNVNVDKRRDGIQRYNSDGQRSPEDRNGRNGNSRIVQVMQEVAIHAGLENQTEHVRNSTEHVRNSHLRETQSAENTPPSMRRTHPKTAPHDPRKIPVYKAGHSAVQFANIAQRMENLHLSESEPIQDEPINYSMKYSDTKPTPQPNGRPPVPKVGNYINTDFPQQPKQPKQATKSTPGPGATHMVS